MTETGRSPEKNEFELTLLGPGYGESVVLHVGGGVWVIVDSCVDTNGTPQALRYLESIDVDPVKAIELEDVAVLLGSDLEKRGWTAVLENVALRDGKASVFKVPHHGSEDAHEPGVWKQMLELDPLAVLTPWRRGNRTLPIQRDVKRILSHTPNAYATARVGSSTRAPVSRASMVRRTIRESGIRLRRLVMSPGFVRLRYPLASGAPWKIETFGSACRLAVLARQ